MKDYALGYLHAELILDIVILQERNIILANSFEYRLPTTSAIHEAAAKETESWDKTEPKAATVKVNMSSRLIGLIVIPGRHITKIELE
jgi:hypothetical protein